MMVAREWGRSSSEREPIAVCTPGLSRVHKVLRNQGSRTGGRPAR